MNRALDVTTYARMIDLDPDDDFIEMRRESIKELRSRLLKRRRIPELIATVSSACEVFRDPSAISEDVRRQVEDAIKKTGASFAEKGRCFELGMYALAAINQSISSGKPVEKWEGWTIPDVLATCVWSGLSFQSHCSARGLEILRRWTIQNARDRLRATSSSASARHRVPAAAEFRGVTVGRNTYNAAVRTISELQFNAMLDNEEIDFLRWMREGRSRIYDRPIETLSDGSRAIITGVELGALTQTPPSSSHRNYLLEGLGTRDLMSLNDVLDELGTSRLRVADSVEDKTFLKKARFVFPLFSGICLGKETRPSDQLLRPLSEWAARALVEQTLLRARL